MAEKKKIHKLPQALINQIAAGEVIERPSSVLKELLDNSIDAGASQVKISISEGGKDLIEVVDNGIGISKEDLPLAFQAHTTSKISTIEDLNTLISMGFRGEALSTIQSVAKVTAISKNQDSDSAYKIEINPEKVSSTEELELKKTAHPQGTTIRVEDLFFNIPARKKYLRKPNTEYRKVQQTLLPYLLIHPEIGFDVYKDNRKIHSLPVLQDASSNTLHALRVQEVLKSSWVDNLIDFYYEGTNVKVGGFIAHPENHVKRTSHQYIFINHRPIYDSGLVKSVLSGFGRYIPSGEKIPFLLSLQIDPELIDVNVHPRKEEIRFSNPYRVYQAVEQAIKDALKREIQNDSLLTTTHTAKESEKGKNHRDNINYERLRKSKSGNSSKKSSQSDMFKDSKGINYRADKKGGVKEMKFNKPGSFNNKQNIKHSLEFSKNILSNKSGKPSLKNSDPIRSLTQVFNKYIIVEFEEKMWVVDQHAAAERVTFERLLKSLNEELGSTQKLLIPVDVKLVDWQKDFIDDNLEFFKSLGFDIEVNKEKIVIKEVAVDLGNADLQKLFNELFEESSDKKDLEKQFTEKKEDFVATMSCHNSIRTGQELNSTVMRKLVLDLLNCENPYSCPHGRPAVWRLSIGEVDKHFERTY